MKIHLLSGFLGSGKTTAIQVAARHLIARGIKTGVITNDQGLKLVDGGLIQSLHIPGRQVVNGCFCCQYEQLDGAVDSLINDNGVEVIFAEAVGSCTDIVATVMKPLLHLREGVSVSISVFADVLLLQMMLGNDADLFDDEVRYIYLKQLEEATLIVVNKIDLLSTKQLVEVKAMMQQRYGNKQIIFQDSLAEDGVLQWLAAISEASLSANLRSLDIDYDIYASGEARLAWFDQELEIFSLDNNAMQQAFDLIAALHAKILDLQYAIGHLKFLLNGSHKISLTQGTHLAESIPLQPAASCTLLINMRLQAPPGSIQEMVAETIREFEIRPGIKCVVNSVSAFKPGYPRPTHRIPQLS